MTGICLNLTGNTAGIHDSTFTEWYQGGVIYPPQGSQTLSSFNTVMAGHFGILLYLSAQPHREASATAPSPTTYALPVLWGLQTPSSATISHPQLLGGAVCDSRPETFISCTFVSNKGQQRGEILWWKLFASTTPSPLPQNGGCGFGDLPLSTGFSLPIDFAAMSWPFHGLQIWARPPHHPPEGQWTFLCTMLVRQ